MGFVLFGGAPSEAMSWARGGRVRLWSVDPGTAPAHLTESSSARASSLSGCGRWHGEVCGRDNLLALFSSSSVLSHYPLPPQLLAPNFTRPLQTIPTSFRADTRLIRPYFVLVTIARHNIVSLLPLPQGYNPRGVQTIPYLPRSASAPLT